MSGWIKVEKDLANDPRVLRMASLLRNADVTLGSRSRLVVVGALVTLWWYADTHIRDDDTLPIGPDQIDELVGVAGFCKLMPTDWLEIIDADNVKLIDYLAHNGTSAKQRALGQKRQEKHRKVSRSRNASITPSALPDLDLEKDQEKREAPNGASYAQPASAGKQPTPEAEMAIALRDVGVTVTSIDPVLIAWVRDGYTRQQAVDAVGIARIRKPHPEPIHPRYLDPILRQPARPPPKAADRVTWRPPPDEDQPACTPPNSTPSNKH